MKSLFLILISFLICAPLKNSGYDIELSELVRIHSLKEKEVMMELEMTSALLHKQLDDLNDKKAVMEECTYVLEKMELESELINVETQANLQFTKHRYKKGIVMIKMIYEKILGLDHHFSALQTFQHITALTNPNSFPEFVKNKDAISEKLDKKKTISLPQVFETNPFVSLTTTLISSLVGNGDKKQKEEDLEKVSCVLDFTVKMHTDLNLIFYETEFLKDANLSLKESALELFRDYCKVVDYNVDLPTCRSTDDWDTLYEQLDETIHEIEESLKSKDSYKRNKLIKKMNNLEFSIDRLLNFIDLYTDFIIQGEQYYAKFNTILNNYNNEVFCIDQLPHQFSDLRRDVDASISKFTEAYGITELNGSKLRDLLYGLPQ